MKEIEKLKTNFKRICSLIKNIIEYMMKILTKIIFIVHVTMQFKFFVSILISN